VYPAAGLIQYYGGRRIVLLNRDETPYDYRATLCIREPIGQVLGQVEVR
jgi:NAD-dependent deacetylase